MRFLCSFIFIYFVFFFSRDSSRRANLIRSLFFLLLTILLSWFFSFHCLICFSKVILVIFSRFIKFGVSTFLKSTSVILISFESHFIITVLISLRCISFFLKYFVFQLFLINFNSLYNVLFHLLNWFLVCSIFQPDSNFIELWFQVQNQSCDLILTFELFTNHCQQ